MRGPATGQPNEQREQREQRRQLPQGGPARLARLAVVGLGRMGRVHAANAARRCPSARLVTIYDASTAVAGELARELGVTPAAGYPELLGDPGVDGVVIATPTATHAELAVQAARAGKHVFCEKPLSLERATSAQAVAALAETGMKLQVGFHRRFDPATAAVVDRARAGDHGEIYMFRATQRDAVPPRPEFLRGSGGIFVDMGVHDLDLARWAVGEVVAVSAHGTAMTPGPREAGDFDNAAVVLEFAGGALGLLDISRVSGYGYDSSFELMGSKATVRVDDPYAARYEWLAGGSSSRPLLPTFDRRFAAAFAAELEEFARCVTEDRPPAVTGEDALAAFDLAQAAEASARSGRPVAVYGDGRAPDNERASNNRGN